MGNSLKASWKKKLFDVSLAGMLAIGMCFGAVGCSSGRADQSEPTVIENDSNPLDTQTSAKDTMVIKAGSATPVAGKADTYYFPNLTIEAPDDQTLKSITVQFTSAVVTGDAITLNASGNFQKLAGSKGVNTTINVPAGATVKAWEEYLRNSANFCITLKGSDLKSIRMIAHSYTVDRIVDYNSVNGHYYELVNPGATWPTAYEESAKKTYMGQQGYLATITTQQEQDFTYSMIGNNCWIGATCNDTYTSQVKNIYGTEYTAQGFATPSTTYTASPGHMTFYWVTGPEKGMLIYDGGIATNVNGSSFAAKYPDGSALETFWWGNEPNAKNELYLLQWYPYSGLWGSYNDSVQAYIIEYGGIPSDEKVDEADIDIQIEINIDPSGKTITTEAHDVTVGSPLDIRENVNGGDVVSTIDGVASPAEIERAFEIRDPVTGQWRELSSDEMNADGQPCHAGDYRVTSKAVYAQSAGGQPEYYNAGSSTFTIKPKTIMPIFTKVYDGTTEADVASADISSEVLDGADVTLTAQSAEYNDCTVSGAESVDLKDAALSGADAADYVLASTGEEGVCLAKGVITPRDLVITATSNVNWGLAGIQLKSADGNDPAYKTNLAIHATGDWAENELASRDALDGDVAKTILGDLSFSVTAGSASLDTANPVKGLYVLSPHFANVNPGDGADVQADKSSVRLMAQGDEDDGGAAHISSGLDSISSVRLSDGRYDIGNYTLTLKGANILITDDPYAEDAYDDATKFISGVVNTQLKEDATPLTDEELLDLIRQIAGGDLPEGTPDIRIFKNGEPVDAIDPSELGSYAIVATYPNPDGEDEVVRVGYNVLQDEPFVMKESVTVPVTEGVDPVTASDLRKLVEGMIPDWIPAGIDPVVTIVDAAGNPISEIDLSSPGSYTATLVYVDENGVAKQVDLSYSVDETDDTIVEGINIPMNPSAPPIVADDIVKRIEDSYPGLIPDGLDPVVTITKDGQTVDAIDPTQSGVYEVTIEYRDPETGEVVKTVKTTYTVVEDPAGANNDDGSEGNPPAGGVDDDEPDAPGTPDSGVSGGASSGGSSGSTGTSTGSSTTSGLKGFNDAASRLLAQTGDPVFLAVCGLVAVAVVSGVIVAVTRRKRRDG